MDQAKDAIRDLWHTLATVGPKIVLFLAILVIGWIVAKLVGRGVEKILTRLGFDQLLDRGGMGKALRGSGSGLVGKLAYYSVLLIVLQMAFGVFGPNPISALLTSVIAYLPRLFVAIALVVVAVTIANAVKGLVTDSIGGLSYGPAVANLARWVIIALGVIAALGQLGVALSVTMPVLVAILATVGGTIVVGAGGGLIKPMQERWERYLSNAENENRKLNGGTQAGHHWAPEASAPLS